MNNDLIEKKFRQLRTTTRNASRATIGNILDNHFDPNNIAGLPDTCIFCGSTDNLTREHVIPKWAFEGDTQSYFITTSNESRQTFNKTVVPACANCNNSYLSYIEKYILQLFQLSLEEFDVNVGKREQLNIIRWLEIIEYKFNVLNFRRKYRSSKTEGYEPILADIPIAVLRRSIKYSPYKAVAELRQSQKRITIKNKEPRFDSLLLFGVKKPGRKFFHAMNSHIYLELPRFSKSIFYFFNRSFEDYETAEKEARKMMKAAFEEPHKSI